MRHISPYGSAFSLILLLYLSACGRKNHSEAPHEKIQTIDSTYIDEFLTQNAELKAFRHEIMEFYKQRDYQLAWSNAGELTCKAYSLSALLRQLNRYGVPVHHQRNPDLSDKIGVGPLNTTDVYLTASFFNYYPKLGQGVLDPHAREEIDWDIEPNKKPDYVQVLDSLLRSSDDKVFQNFKFHNEFNELKKALRTYQTIESEGGWPVVPTGDKGKLSKGDSGLAVLALRDRLLASGDLKTSVTVAVFTAEIQQAVMAFQRRHGLVADGIVRGKTLSTLNTPVEVQIRKIILNMERWRWIPLHHLKGNYVLINIPEYELRIYEEDKVKAEMKIVVGKGSASTNVFNDVIQKIVLNPYWNIPTSIAVAEILPQIQKDVSYLRKHHIEVGIDWKFDSLNADTVDWKNLSADNFPYTLRRKPGDGNPLGKIKFIFPNRYAIYLHDTPATALFDEHERSFSHGCIRVEKPLILAEHLVSPMKDITMRKLQRLLKKEKEDEEIVLSEPVPVYMLYLTAWVDEQGHLNFRDDVYGHDEILARLLFPRAG